jgi:RNA polymerase sigma-70 factor, ECF subfamily
MDPTSDAELVDRARTGDVDAFTLLVGRYRLPAVRLAYGIAGNEAEDAVQDAFVKLWVGTAQFDEARGSMRGLLLTITRHTSIDAIRKRTRRQRTETTYYAEAPHVIDGPERATECADDARHIRSALVALPDQQRRAIEMAYFSGLTRREIATSHAVPEGTVKSRMRLGMAKLALTLADRRG